MELNVEFVDVEDFLSLPPDHNDMGPNFHPEAGSLLLPLLLPFFYIEGIWQTLLYKATYEVHFSEDGQTIYGCRYSKDCRRTKCQALTIARLTNFL